MNDTTPTKAITAGIAFGIAVLGSLAVAVTAGSDGGATITASEWLQGATVGLSGAGGVFGVFQVTNKPKRKRQG